jgi:hypothetical protein
MSRPAVPPESPTLGFTHLRFEALLTAARESANDNDFALVAMLSLRIFEATGVDIGDLGDEHGCQVLQVCGKGSEVELVRCHPPSGGRSMAPSAHVPADQSCSSPFRDGLLRTVADVGKITSQWVHWCKHATTHAPSWPPPRPRPKPRTGPP